MTETQRFSSVWDAIEDTPQQAASMRARSELMMHLTEVIRERGVTQGAAAALFGVTQPRVSDLMRGKINLFSLDALIDMAATAGMNPTVKVTKPKSVRSGRAKRVGVPKLAAATYQIKRIDSDFFADEQRSVKSDSP
jgi:predicted XRE-type DNA-binding protein